VSEVSRLKLSVIIDRLLLILETKRMINAVTLNSLNDEKRDWRSHGVARFVRFAETTGRSSREDSSMRDVDRLGQEALSSSRAKPP